MGLRERVISLSLVLSLFVLGCSAGSRSGGDDEEDYHPGPKINIPDFAKNTVAYKGKTIALLLRVDEVVAQDQGQRLRALVGRDVQFRTADPKGLLLNLVITIPKDLPVPDVQASAEVSVRFVCARGNLRQGNEAKSIEKR